MFKPASYSKLKHVNVLEGYRRWSNNYDQMLSYSVDETILINFIKQLQLKPDSWVLDIGCGTGRNVQSISKHGLNHKTIGVDISPDMLALAESKNIYQKLVLGNLPDLDQKFKLCMSILMSCHLESLDKLFEYAIRHLNEDGYFLLIDMHPHMFNIGMGTIFPDKGEHVYISNHQHQLSDYYNTAKKYGFNLIDLKEAFVPESWRGKSQYYSRYIGQPLSLGLLWQKSN